MSDPVKEQLSACLDGELSRAELDLVLKQVGRDPELKAAMSRYAAIGELVRSAGSVRASKDFASRVTAAVEAEAPLAATKRATVRTAPAWLRPVTGLAVAAGVAAVAVIVLQMGTATDVPPAASAPQLAQATPPAATQVVEPTTTIVPAASPQVSHAPVLDARLANYVVAHSEFSSPLGRRTVLSGVLTQDVDNDSGPPENQDQRTPTR
jgi:sigma-E factor negative regulatory protein RseA